MEETRSVFLVSPKARSYHYGILIGPSIHSLDEDPSGTIIYVVQGPGGKQELMHVHTHSIEDRSNALPVSYHVLGAVDIKYVGAIKAIACEIAHEVLETGAESWIRALVKKLIADGILVVKAPVTFDAVDPRMRAMLVSVQSDADESDL